MKKNEKKKKKNRYSFIFISTLSFSPTNRLLASRILRVRKLIQYVCEKLQIEDEDSIEMVCGETILEKTMTLATIKQYVLKVSGDIPLAYRLKNESIAE
jgi:WD repeat-containing protein 48